MIIESGLGSFFFFFFFFFFFLFLQFQKDWDLPSISTVVAHEMGHNLGMNHDSGRCDCDCIMGAGAG